MIREPIISVLGHVDHGKTLFLDKIRGSTLAEREAGNITQHIGATEIPIKVILEISGDLLAKFGFSINIPGLLFIDTPGHEAFTNLRKRGGSISDLAVLIVDINQGFQPQTIEAIEILRSYKTPFIVAATKIDRLRQWDSVEGSFLKNLKNQSSEAVKELDEKLYELVLELHKKGFESERLDRCENLTRQIPIIPVSNKTGEGIPETLMLLAGLSQKFLKKTLEVSDQESMNATVLEVREERGFGATVDIILYTGKISTGEEIVLGGKNGLIKTKIRALLKPEPLEEMRDTKKKFKSVKEVTAACGVKIAAPGLDDSLPGSPVILASMGEEAEKKILGEIEAVKIKGETGIVIKADTLGSLEALTRMLSEKNFPIKSADIGNITKHDVMEAESVKLKDSIHGVIIGFSTGIDKHAKLEAKKNCIKIFTGNVIYSILEEYEEFVENEKGKQKLRKEGKVVLPAKFKFLRGCVFRRSKPAVFGAKILNGRLRPGAKIMNAGGKVIGKLNCLQCDGKDIKEAKTGDEVAVALTNGVIGRNIDEGEMFYTFIPEIQFAEVSSLELKEGEKELFGKIREIENKNQEELE